MHTHPPPHLYHFTYRTMSPPPKQVEREAATAEQPNDGLRFCDFCTESPALLYCRADDARLCLACDRHVHAANTVSSKHPRSLLCDSCFSAPASALCCTQRLLLCHNCDFDAHQLPGSTRGGHVRRPIEPFSGCPGVVELMALLGLGEDEKCLGLNGDGEGLMLDGEEWVWEGKEVFNFEDLIVPMDAGHGFQAVGVPPLPKDRNLSCGKHKEEILRQLRGMLTSEFDCGHQLWNQEQDLEFQPPVSEQSIKLENKDFVFRGGQEASELLDDEVNFLLWQSDYCESADSFLVAHDPLVQATTEDNQNQDIVGEMENDHLISAAMPLVSLRAAYELSGAERDSAISRYREKRKTRRYDKRIIYESRKARAESRVRIKGRFAKINRDARA